ncbi:MAG: TIGR03905 family TSCPD domain-containing protein [Candidatus Gastranaerophilales bacterium]|nr:TIGR03905 family TSCPD domain-containing protein [Candidatus Gastranaerophilales bacterium]
MKIQYQPQGVCSKIINLEIENNKVISAEFIGGCDGNAKGICSLVKNMSVNEVIEKLQGITCGPKSTSCPDQLAKCLIHYQKEVEQTV